MRTKYEVLASHRWVRDCLISESVSVKKTISGFYSKKYLVRIEDKGIFKIFEGLYLGHSDDFIPKIIFRVERLKYVLGGAK